MKQFEIGGYICPDCESIREPYIYYTYEFKDRDGKRGVKTRVYKCADCGHIHLEFLY